jgi:histidinol-phosphate aminotransferase
MNLINLASNENPLGPSPRAVQAMRAAVVECHLYPDNDATALRQRLAEKHGVAAEHIVVAAGSSDLLEITCRALLKPGLNAVIGRLSFIVYSIAIRAANGEPIEVPMRNNAFDLEAIAAAINRDTRIVFLANPNNPTGTLFNAQQLDAFLAAVPPSVTVVVDEAYYDYAQFFANSRGVEYSRSLEYVREGRNLVVLRTFSKAPGLAGVRVGYGFGPPKLMARLAAMRTTFSVSGVAQAGALAAMDDEAHVRKAVQSNAEGAASLFDSLSRLGCRVTPTWANFLYCELTEEAAVVAKGLQDRGVIIRPLGSWGAPNAIRVTVGTPEQNELLVDAFGKVVGGS